MPRGPFHLQGPSSVRLISVRAEGPLLPQCHPSPGVQEQTLLWHLDGNIDGERPPLPSLGHCQAEQRPTHTHGYTHGQPQLRMLYLAMSTRAELKRSRTGGSYIDPSPVSARGRFGLVPSSLRPSPTLFPCLANWQCDVMSQGGLFWATHPPNSNTLPSRKEEGRPSRRADGLVSTQRYPGWSTCVQRTRAEMSQPFLLDNNSNCYILPQAAQFTFSVGNAWP